MNFIYYDAAQNKVSISPEEVSDAGEYIGESPGAALNPKSQFARFVAGSLLKKAGYNLTGISIVTYVLPNQENQET